MRLWSLRSLIFGAVCISFGCQPQTSWDVHYQETGSCATYEDPISPAHIIHTPLVAFHLVSVTNTSPVGTPAAEFSFRKLSITGSSALDAMPHSVSPVYGDVLLPGRTHLYPAHQGNMAAFLPGENPEELRNEVFVLTYDSPPGVSVKLTKDPSPKQVLLYCSPADLAKF
jgi:hypothetical protein